MNSQDGQRSDVPEQTNSGTALNGTSGDIEMSEDTALPVGLLAFLQFLSPANNFYNFPLHSIGNLSC